MEFNHSAATGLLYFNMNDNTITVKGAVTSLARDPVIRWIAADPAQKILSRYGSLQAFPNAQMAISGKNCGVMRTKRGNFSFTVKIPNSYYANGGTILIPPHIVLGVHDGNTFIEDNIVLSHMYPYKGLTWAPQRNGPEF